MLNGRCGMSVPAFARTRVLIPAVAIGGLLSSPALGDGGDGRQNSAAHPADARFAPYSADPEHPWNRLHRALFVREAKGTRHVHSTDPLLYRGGTYLLG